MNMKSSAVIIGVFVFVVFRYVTIKKENEKGERFFFRNHNNRYFSGESAESVRSPGCPAHWLHDWLSYWTPDKSAVTS